MRLPNNAHMPITNTAWVHTRFVNYKKGALDSQRKWCYKLLAIDRWFYPGIPASSTTKTGRHDIADKLMKVALNTIKSINQNQ
jgi:hypothetical protein